jgi:hypothetical protein
MFLAVVMLTLFSFESSYGDINAGVRELLTHQRKKNLSFGFFWVKGYGLIVTGYR